MIVKGKNRDTAWFSIVDDEWPGVQANFEAYFGTPGVSLRAMNRGAEARSEGGLHEDHRR
jgi:hypothetical protein